MPAYPAGSSYTGFVAELNPAGSGLVYSTFLGGTTGDECYHLALDAAGDAYVTGSTLSADFPTTGGAYQAALGNANGNAFVAKLNPSGTALLYSTFLGGTAGGGDWGDCIALDGAGNAYLSGTAGDTDFPTTAGAYQTASGGGLDAFMTELNPTGSGLVYSTFLGGSSDDYGNGLALDAAGGVYLGGTTNSSNFPTVAGSFQTTANTVSEAYVSKLNLLTPTPTPTVTATATVTGTPTQTPTPLPDCSDFQVLQNVFHPDQGPLDLVAQAGCLDGASMKVYNSAGEFIKSLTLPSPLPPAGPVTLTWDGTNQAGDACASGVYLFEYMTSLHAKLRRVILIKSGS
jgi:large repetitive protein